MVIAVKMKDGTGYSIDSCKIDGGLIELKKTSQWGKSQITILPLDDILDLDSNNILFISKYINSRSKSISLMFPFNR